MCQQCIAQSAILIEKVLPGFSLMVSTKDSAHWPEGHYGLVERNDPMFTWAGPLVKDPFRGMSDDAVNAMADADHEARWRPYNKAAQCLKAAMRISPRDGHALMQACLLSGYRPEVDGDLHFWLVDYLARAVFARLHERPEPQLSQDLEQLLAQMGYHRGSVADDVRYVLTVVLSPDSQHAIGLVKAKGPSNLIGKLTFPGGRVESGETAAFAASRELKEEAGVIIAPEHLVNIVNSATMAVFAARSDQVMAARTLDDEEVVILAVPRSLEYQANNPSAYAPEFSVFLRLAELLA